MSGTTNNQRLNDWVGEWAAIMQPADIYWCDGSADEYEALCQTLRRLDVRRDDVEPGKTASGELVDDGRRADDYRARATGRTRTPDAGKVRHRY